MARELGRGGAPHVFVDDLDAPRLSDDDRHHLGRALRLRPGDPLTLSDGRGRWRWARFGDEKPHRWVPMDEFLRAPVDPGPGRHLVICAHGVRSLYLAQWLQAQGFARVASLRGGLAGLGIGH